jgi:spermidine/putrescine transport system ATP-binding protein
MSDSFLSIETVSRHFKGKTAVDSFDLQVAQGEFVSLLGPSGCGKTTLLRILAGFEYPDEGRVLVDGRDITNLAPNRRPVNLVFQRVTLFPHLDVYENVSFGLRLSRVRKHEMRERVARYLDLVRLPGFETRDVTTLSGGEAQRVALARALINEPKVLLLDEPLAALDLQVRRQIQVELKEIHRTLGTTFVYVTHDQEEALRMSDRVVLMNEGRRVQVGTPYDVYRQPATVFAASFVGASNLIHGEVARSDGSFLLVRSGTQTLRAPHTDGVNVGASVTLLLRPEQLVLSELSTSGDPTTSIRGSVVDVSFLGSIVSHRVACEGVTMQVDRPLTGDTPFREGDDVLVTWSPEDVLVLSE